MNNTISASQARTNFYTLIDEVSKKLKRFTITKRGEAKVVLMHPDEVASWEETMEVLADKKVVGQILKSELERKKGDKLTESQLYKKLGISSKDLA
jgi:antitoxin YefM